MRSLGARLTFAFVVVAVVGVVSLAALTLLTARSEVFALVERQRDATAAAVVASLEDAYAAAGSWEQADLRPAQTLVIASEVTLTIRTADGRLVSTRHLDMANMMARMHGDPVGPLQPARPEPVTAAGQRVGTALLRFPADELPGPTARLQAGLARRVVIGTLLAALVAALVAVVVARRITVPVSRLVAAVDAFERGDSDARADVRTEITELEALAGAFDRMASTIQQRARQREKMAGDVAHELRTPIAVLQASVESMLDGHEPAAGEQLASLHDEVLRLQRTVEDLESLAAAEGSQLSFARAPIDLATIARQAATAARPHFDAAKVVLATDLAPAWVDGDAHRLMQVVTNLLTNAAKFTPAGGRVDLSVSPHPDAAELRVRDTGPGVASEELPHLFERFWRGRSAHSTSGSGIGLAITAELVHAHDGDVQVISRPGAGATFVVRLPAAHTARRR